MRHYSSCAYSHYCSLMQYQTGSITRLHLRRKPVRQELWLGAFFYVQYVDKASRLVSRVLRALKAELLISDLASDSISSVGGHPSRFGPVFCFVSSCFFASSSALLRILRLGMLYKNCCMPRLPSYGTADAILRLSRFSCSVSWALTSDALV